MATAVGRSSIASAYPTVPKATSDRCTAFNGATSAPSTPRPRPTTRGRASTSWRAVVDKLNTSPYDRRIILTAWNPADLAKMALPPCHMLAQFYVSFPGARRGVASAGIIDQGDANANGTRGRGSLHCLLYQRSCDVGLGVPFNMASYALLTHMLAHVCDLVPGELTHAMGDAHVYSDHVGALQEQVQREPRPFPTLRIGRERGGSIDGWEAGDFVVEGYDPHKGIAMKMSV